MSPWLEVLLAELPEPPPPDPAGATARAAVVRAALVLAMHYIQTHTVKSDERETLLEAGYLATRLPRP
jgi:hypothetical protein